MLGLCDDTLQARPRLSLIQLQFKAILYQNLLGFDLSHSLGHLNLGLLDCSYKAVKHVQILVNGSPIKYKTMINTSIHNCKMRLAFLKISTLGWRSVSVIDWAGSGGGI